MGGVPSSSLLTRRTQSALSLSLSLSLSLARSLSRSLSLSRCRHLCERGTADGVELEPLEKLVHATPQVLPNHLSAQKAMTPTLSTQAQYCSTLKHKPAPHACSTRLQHGHDQHSSTSLLHAKHSFSTHSRALKPTLSTQTQTCSTLSTRAPTHAERSRTSLLPHLIRRTRWCRAQTHAQTCSVFVAIPT